MVEFLKITVLVIFFVIPVVVLVALFLWLLVKHIRRKKNRIRF
jgi:uncharacterized membrane protein